ncbi:MAG: 2-oxo acid dehydrogenase subunit E2 [Nannocystis sp.]|nr:2-oxo acid dehydrogenase subunit E2 [Nannocystis sp.]MBA3550478.1 2-oxo acid dehydrogenase subunit E2 [Nannocystis sp.]
MLSDMGNVRLRRLKHVSTFRRLALAAWGAPVDPTIHGTLEIDATAALDYLERARGRSDVKVTLTHLVGRALATVLAEYPELNVLIRWGRFYQRDDVDIFFQVALQATAALGDVDLSGVVVRNADRKTVLEIAGEFAARVQRVRDDRDPELAGLRNRLGQVPPLLLRPLQSVLDFIQYSFNIKLPGLPRDAFGSAMITNIGMFGTRWAYAPLFPPSHCPIVVLIGAVHSKPWVIHEPTGEQLAIRPILPLHASMDHRVLDGVQAARVATRLEHLLMHPDELDA